MQFDYKKAGKLLSEVKLKRTFKLIWSITPVATSLTLLMIAVENVLFLSTAYIFKHLIDNIIHSDKFTPEIINKVKMYLLEGFLVVILLVITRSISQYISQWQAAKVGEYIDDKIHENAVKLDLAFYESPAYFDTLKRAKDAGSERPNALVVNLVDITKNGIMFLVSSYVIISINWLLLPILAICVIPTFFVRVTLAEKLFQLKLAHTPTERKASYFSSLITGDLLAKEIRVFGLGNYLKEMYLKIRLDLLAQRLKIIKRGAFNDAITSIVASIGFFGCIAFICYNTVQGKITFGDISLFIVVFPQLFNVLQALSQGLSGLYQNSVFVTYLFQFFDLKPSFKKYSESFKIIDSSQYSLTVENVSFNYPNSDHCVLSNINLNVSPGKIVAIVGLNGAGKTTLIKLLCRLYDPTSGTIRLGDQNIKKINVSDFRKCVSVVFQDFGKYNLSVLDNIKFGDIDGDRSIQEIIEAAHGSGANSYIDEFPNGYHTIMGRIFEDGREISIGQWQKMAIARALFSPSKFIILDEATSALDALAEHEFFNTFRKNIGNRGAIVISHRVSAVKHADYIYVMADGKVVQQGTHKDLIAMEGNYATIFEDKDSEDNV